MIVFGYVSDFKIRKKADAEAFVNMCDGQPCFCGKYTGVLYWTDGERDYCFDANAKRVSMRWARERGNIFSPYFECRNYPFTGATVVDVVWFFRKYINAQIFGEERWY